MKWDSQILVLTCPNVNRDSRIILYEKCGPGAGGQSLQWIPSKSVERRSLTHKQSNAHATTKREGWRGRGRRGPSDRPKGEEEERKEGGQWNEWSGRQSDGQGCNPIDIFGTSLNLSLMMSDVLRHFMTWKLPTTEIVSKLVPKHQQLSVYWIVPQSGQHDGVRGRRRSVRVHLLVRLSRMPSLGQIII